MAGSEIQLTSAVTKTLGWRVLDEDRHLVLWGESQIRSDGTFDLPSMGALPLGKYIVETDPVVWEGRDNGGL